MVLNFKCYLWADCSLLPPKFTCNLCWRLTTISPGFIKIGGILSKQCKENGTDVSAEFPAGSKIATGQSFLPSMTTKTRNLLLWDKKALLLKA